MYTLMIVNQEPLERKVLRKIITESFSNRIQILDDVLNGYDAIHKAKKHRPDILIMNVNMPKINGFEVQAEIIKFLPGIQTIFLATSSDFNHATQAIKLKAKDYLLKPVRPQMIQASMTSILNDLDLMLDPKLLVDSKEQEVDMIGKVLNYIHSHFREEIDLQAISDFIHLNPQYFSRWFKKETGVSFVHYLNALRVSHACELLTNTSYPVYRVAIETGFSDSSYFSRVFTKHVQFTPSDYRRIHSEYC